MLQQALGRVLRTDLRADRDVPPFNRITLDGYALRSLELFRGDRRFEVTGFQSAGSSALRLSNKSHSCLEVATGAVLPEGADTVVPSEFVIRENGHIRLTDEAMRLVTGHAVHPRASDSVMGTPLVQSGSRLGARELAVAASLGYASIPVASIPRITIISTGDELVDPSAQPEAWQIRRSNDTALGAALQAAGFTEIRLLQARDTEAELIKTMGSALEQSECVLTTGSISKGRLDLLAGIFGRLGIWELFHGVNQKPGKPFYFGRASNDVPVFALPGNPAAAFILLHRYVIPALAQASGVRSAARPVHLLAEPVRPDTTMSLFLPVVIQTEQPGEPRIRIQRINTSGDYTGLLGAHGFVQVPPGQVVLAAGSPLEVWSLG